MTFQPPTPSRLADMTSDLSRVPLLPQHNRSIITLPTSQSSRNAHTVAQCAFALGLCALLYGALGDPTLKQIADKQQNAFSPNWMVVSGLLGAQVLLHISWLCSSNKLPSVAPYALGQVCLAAWALFWIYELFVPAAIAAVLYLFLPVTALAFPSKAREHADTRVVMKYNASFAVLGVLATGAVALELDEPPLRIVKALAGVFFVFATLKDDIFFAPILLIDLVALAVNQKGMWATELWWMTFGVFVVASIKFQIFEARRSL